MRILFIIGDLSGGGAEKILVDFANYLVLKFQVTVVTLSSDVPFYTLDRRIELIQLNLYRKSGGFFEKLRNNIERVKKIKEALCRINPDIVISFLMQTNILAIMANLWCRKPLIVAEHSIYWAKENGIGWRALRRIMYRFADCVVILTKDDAKHYSFLSTTEVIPNFIDIAQCDCATSSKENLILAVGRLHPVKRFDLLIELFARIQTNWKLFIVGEGPERKRLEALIKQYGLKERVFLTGQRIDVNTFYKRAKIFVLTSEYESFSNVLLEAICQGCIPISFDCDYGPRNILQGKCGYLVKNEKEFINILQGLIDNYEELSLNHLSRCCKLIREFDRKKILKHWEKLIFDVIDKKKSNH